MSICTSIAKPYIARHAESLRLKLVQLKENHGKVLFSRDGEKEELQSVYKGDIIRYSYSAGNGASTYVIKLIIVDVTNCITLSSPMFEQEYKIFPGEEVKLALDIRTTIRATLTKKGEFNDQE